MEAMSPPRSPAALNECFAMPGVVAFEAGPGGLPRAVITSRAAVTHVHLHGAQVTHHQPAGEPPLLFLSSRSRFASGAAIRGGVPVVFPWFGPRAGDPAAPDHGFARISDWTVESVEQSGGGVVEMILGLEPSDASRRLWPHDFRLRLAAVIGARLELTLEVENRSPAPFTFEQALHAYLRVGDVGDVSITGLEGVTYIDKTDGLRRKALPDGPFRLDGPTDRVFLGTTSTCRVADPRLGRRLVIDKRGSSTTVVWNPWRERARAMSDLGPGEWRSMLCVEAANAGDDAVTLGAGERHVMGIAIRADHG
jgi:D-hexose-6-phosphate mutarotase